MKCERGPYEKVDGDLWRPPNVRWCIGARAVVRPLCPGDGLLIDNDSLYLWATAPPLPPGFPDTLRRMAAFEHPHVGAAVGGMTGQLLAFSRKGQIHSAIIDLHRVIDEVVSIPTHMRVVVSSGFSITGAVQAILDNGAFGFVQKTFMRSELLTTVHKALWA